VTTGAVWCCLSVAVLCVGVAPAAAQSSTPGPAIDIEVYNPMDGGNLFCAAPGDTVSADVWVSPATGGASSIQCSAPCGSLAGGPGHIAAATLDVSFDPAHLAYRYAFSNGFLGFAAGDGLLQLQSLAAGRIGWALAGDWTPDANPGGSLAEPCQTALIEQPNWILRMVFNVSAAGTSQIALRNLPDFPMAFADLCGSDAFTTVNGGIDEVIPATISSTAPNCPELSDIIFRNGFETGDTVAWQQTPAGFGVRESSRR
jgi:hypothetical protein